MHTLKQKLKLNQIFKYLNREQRNWFNLSEELISEKGDNIDWNYTFNALDAFEMLEKLNILFGTVIGYLIKEKKKKSLEWI